MDTRLFTKTLTETVSLDRTLPPHGARLYEPLIQSVTTVISETRPLSPSYTTRSILDALFSPRPRTRYFVGWDARAAWLLRSLLPDRVLDVLFVTLIPDTLSRECNFKGIKEDEFSNDLLRESLPSLGRASEKR